MPVAGVVEELDGGESLAAGKTGFGKELAGTLGIVGDDGWTFVAAGAGRGKIVGGELVSLGDGFDDLCAINCHGEGATDAGIVEGRPLDIQAIEVSRKLGVLLE